MFRQIVGALVVGGLVATWSSDAAACDGRGGRPTPPPSGSFGSVAGGGSYSNGGSLAVSGRLFTSPGSWLYMMMQNQQRQAAYNQAYQQRQTAILSAKAEKKERQLETRKALRAAELAKREETKARNLEQQSLRHQQQSLAYSVSLRATTR